MLLSSHSGDPALQCCALDSNGDFQLGFQEHLQQLGIFLAAVQHRCTLTLKSRGGNKIINKLTHVVSRLSSTSFLPVEKCSPPVWKVFLRH